MRNWSAPSFFQAPFCSALLLRTCRADGAALSQQLPAFCRRERQSAIMAMNSEFVGLPLMLLTV